MYSFNCTSIQHSAHIISLGHSSLRIGIINISQHLNVWCEMETLKPTNIGKRKKAHRCILQVLLTCRVYLCRC